ncbi:MULTISPECIES: F0F1 ATP synthase subunit alpha [Kandleria]|uniref:F0F1 ATP synthase subunit alpha n=1 Tax=Kandleria TaxID=1279388 RepID=UPI00048F56E4|nr:MULTISPECIES: F0F1 ATP synthase subunit alpha [Kandleria]MBP3275692.1 F0F1 ATP synthase subunit alpha [Kandleria sp.]SDL90084.1 F-type H+-transporting ATPase subunit alpha [Kandleria vitulina]SEI55186.1 F-type H+-transporting ATPase subunit alpha [Kandleria vitulina]
MSLRPDEISALIKEQIKHFDDVIEQKDVGTVMTVGDGVSLIHGLDNAMLGELIAFPGDVYGMVMNLDEDSVGVTLLGNADDIKEGDEVRRTGRIIEVPVGDELLGRVVNPLGQAIDGQGEIHTTKTRPIERIAPGVMTRKSVDEPVQTGITTIDAIIPIGRGQRELIIGDRQTGKTAIAIDTILNQKGQNIYCIYVAIGQKNSTVAQVVNKLKQGGAMEYTTVVSASASELAPVQYIAPYAGCAIGEEWLEQGKDVLIVYDDLSKHAVAYRTLSLLLKRAPGREAYPGDVFYLHSRLLERACKLNEENGGGSITALPIIETQAGDISAYIPTNVISITDGQIFLQQELFNSGFRPAIDTGLSVSRVGSAAQIKAMKQVSSSLKFELAQYTEMQSFAQFGSDLDEATQATIDHGERIRSVLVQSQYSPRPVTTQILTLFALKNGLTKTIKIEKMTEFMDGLVDNITAKHPEYIKEIEEKKVLSDALSSDLKTAMKAYVEQFERLQTAG